MKENENAAAPWIKRTGIKDMLIEKAIAVIALLLIIAIFHIEMYGLVYIKNNLEIPDLLRMICVCFTASFIFGIAAVAVPWILPSLFDSYMLPDLLYPLWSKIEEAVNKKDNELLETIYQKNDALLQAFEQKKHLERT